MVTAWRWLQANKNYFIIFLVPLFLLPLPLVVPGTEASCGYVIIIMAVFWCTEALPLAVTALFPMVLFPMMDIMDSTSEIQMSPKLSFAVTWCTHDTFATGHMHVYVHIILAYLTLYMLCSWTFLVCSQYLKDTNMLFIGGLLVAISVEKWNLHKRIALRVLLIVGVKPALLFLGFMIVTAFLSMWISNTATTAMMIPIAQAVLEQLYSSESILEEYSSEINSTGDSDGQLNGNVNQALEMQEEHFTDANSLKQEKPGDTKVIIDLEDDKLKQEKQALRLQKHLKLCKGISLCVCYSSSIGGIATLTGTVPNLVLKGQMDELFPGNNNVINFASWFGFALPIVILLLALAWIWLQIMFLGINFRKNFGCGSSPEQKEKEKRAYKVISAEHKKLGSMTFAEICVLVLFVLLVILWFLRDPGFMPGWATISFNKQGKENVTDATVALFIALMLFLFPSECPSCKPKDPEQTGENVKAFVPSALLDWTTVNKKMPWNIVFLLGGGFALAKGCEDSGLSRWIGEKLTPLESIPPAAIALVLCLLVATFTECTSNVATTTLFLPILASMAKAIQRNPLYIMLPCTLSASFAFMLPVATPPNAIAFSYGQLKVVDMAKAGFILNILGVLVITMAINSWGFYMFDLGTFPYWANSTGNP